MDNYWENRYKTGGNSGSGSYNEDAKFKATVINNYIVKYGIKTISDFGCGDGNQISLLSGFALYHGYDISNFIIDKNTVRFANTGNMFFYKNIKDLPESDLCMSLDVIYHLVGENDYEEYLTELFTKSKKYVLIYSTNRNSDANELSYCCHHIFTDWVDKNCKNFELVDNEKYLYRMKKSMKIYV